MGRKKMKTGEKVDLRLRVDSDLARQIQRLADEDRTTVAAFVRALIVKELKQRKKEGGTK